MTLPIDRRQSVWPRSIDAAGDDPWAAALIAHHAWYVYGRFRADPAWTPFFADMTRRRDDQIARAGGRLDLDTLERDYALVRLADLISLVFCNRWTDPHGDFGYDIRGDGGAAVIVSPDPFAGADVPLEVPARVLARRPFRDDADLRVEWARAERVTLRGTLTGRG